MQRRANVFKEELMLQRSANASKEEQMLFIEVLMLSKKRLMLSKKS